jgi:hypothetical protein
MAAQSELHMSQKEVQANSVIYSRKDYIALLADVKRAYKKLKTLRAAQIEEWKSDTEAREKDLEGTLIARYTREDYYKYNDYVERLAKPVTLSWWKKLLGIKPVQKTDEYGSAVAYTSMLKGTNFDEYKSGQIADAMQLYGDRVEILRRFAANAREFLVNEWTEELEVITPMLAEVEYGNLDAQFIIPREEFDKYAAALLLADAGKLEPVEGKIYPNRGWYEW